MTPMSQGREHQGSEQTNTLLRAMSFPVIGKACWHPGSQAQWRQTMLKRLIADERVPALISGLRNGDTRASDGYLFPMKELGLGKR